MAIDVTCPGCKARFQVSEKFAGKKGPCPKCKAVILVPAVAEQVEIHAPAVVAGPKGSMGQAALKPLRRTETKVTWPMILVVVGTILFVFIMAVVLRVKNPKDFPPVMLIFGALLLGPTLAWAGYSFLRDDELEPYRGRSMWLRVSACGLVYAALWGLWFLVKWHTPLIEPHGRALLGYEFLYITPFLFAGGFAAFVSLDLSYGNGLLHYGLYLLVTVLLRWIVNVGVL